MPAVTIEPLPTPIVLDEPIVTPEPIVTDEPAITDEPIVTPVISDEFAVTDEPVITSEPVDTPTNLPVAIPAEAPPGEQIDSSLTLSNPVNEPLVNNNRNTSKIGKVKIELSVSRKKGKLYLKWKKIKGIDGYQIQYSRKRTFLKKQTKSTKRNDITLKGLNSKKKYYIRIRAYSQKKNWKHGKWSKVVDVKIK